MNDSNYITSSYKYSPHVHSRYLEVPKTQKSNTCLFLHVRNIPWHILIDVKYSIDCIRLFPMVASNFWISYLN